VDAAGNLYIAGTPDSESGSHDIALLKYSSDGNLLWAKSWGGTGSEGVSGTAVDSLGHVYLTGGTDSFGAGDGDVFLHEWNPDGELLRAITWGTSAHEGISTPLLRHSGNILVSCYTKALEFPRQGVVLEFNASWELLLSIAADASSMFGAVCEDSGGNLLLAGYSVDNTWAWASISGAIGDVDNTTTDFAGIEAVLGGTTGDCDGVTGEPQGIEDTGGGGGDALVVKNIPR